MDAAGGSPNPGNEGSRHWGEEVEEDAVWGVYLKKVRYQRPSSIVQIVQPPGHSSGGKHSHPHGKRHNNYNGTSNLGGHVLVYNHQPHVQTRKPASSKKKYGTSTSSIAASTDFYGEGPSMREYSEELEEGDQIDGGSGQDGDGNDDNGEIAHLMWETVKIRVLRAGSLRKIIEAIENEDTDVQATHLSVFLATYRAFATPQDVIHEIFNIYRTSTSETLIKAMLDCLNVWLDSYSEDFEPGADGYDCLRKLILPFAQEEQLTSLALKIQYKLRSRRKMKKSVSVHSLRTYSPLNIKHYSLHSIPEAHFAQQLTYSDKELFLNLRVWECLGGLWKRRCGCASVVATVEQFNALSGRVVATILLDGLATLNQRAKIVDKWIRIAQELRLLKNFSSLKAIISALESNPIFRLTKVWQLISKDRLAIYHQLAQIFSEENNRIAQRSILEAEGTAKFSTSALSSACRNPKDKSRFFSRVIKGSGSGSSGAGGGGGIQGTLTRDHHGKRGATIEFDSPNGTIPYLGTFLTDLTFIDAAIPDRVRNGLHNFDKRKKEFEILAQLKLLQGSAKGYRLEEDPYFTSWFNSLMVLDDKAAYELSLSIQPEKTPLKGHRKSDSFASNSSSENPDGIIQRKGSIPSSNESSSLLYGNNVITNGNMSVATRHSTGSNNSSSTSLLSPSTSYANLNAKSKSPPPHAASPSGSTTTAASGILPPTETSIVVKVSSPSKDSIMYKSILIGNSDHTLQVIAQALEKLDLSPADPKKYNLVQILPHKELKFPINANIFYALDTSSSAHGDIRLEVRATCSNLSGGAATTTKSPSPILSLSGCNINNNNNETQKLSLNSSQARSGGSGTSEAAGMVNGNVANSKSY